MQFGYCQICNFMATITWKSVNTALATGGLGGICKSYSTLMQTKTKQFSIHMSKRICTSSKFKQLPSINNEGKFLPKRKKQLTSKLIKLIIPTVSSKNFPSQKRRLYTPYTPNKTICNQIFFKNICTSSKFRLP